ncbi:ABC transporter substrate-binding protein [Thermococcus nautili]|uniref:ABC-type Fe3+-hydroxamate transport system, periplasmic component n=1 Tax=Thermococcus nautili TaxID=195522 RepID=W8NS50_9EURY|nr:helical backbone metal receptor [Thermococcus nautili]AHL22068.1 ABC-type Fe3+-hydroxamate transport system, periplasmic component [Thermococcus nautili]
MKRTALLVVLLLLGAVVATGCIASNESTSSTSSPSATATPTSSTTSTTSSTTSSSTTQMEKSYYPITVKDFANRTVTIKEEPKRVVSLAPAVTEDLYYLGLLDRVVGDTGYEDWPPEVKNITSVGGYGAYASLEKIASLKPDLIIADNAVLYKQGYLESLEKIAPVIIVAPKSLDEIPRAIELLGKVFNREDKAKEVIDEFNAKVDAMKELMKDQPKVKVFYVIWNKPLMTAGGNTFISDVISIAGGVNIFNDTKNWPQVSLEEVLARNPDVIILTPHCGMTVEEAYKLFAGTNAVKNGHVYMIENENDLIHPSPRLIRGIETMARILHPDAFKTSYPLTIKDMANRTVIIPKEPQRIVSLAPSITETIFYLGAGDRLVGVTKYADWPPAVKNITKVGGYGAYANLEEIAKLKPDLIIADNAVFYKQGFLESLEKIAPVVIVDPKSIDGIYQQVELLGKVLDREEQASLVVAEMKAQISYIEGLVANASRPSVMYLVSTYNGYWIAGKDTFADSIIRIAGGKNAFEDVTGWKAVSEEEVVARNPDVVIIASAYVDPKIFCSGPLSTIKAAKDGRVYTVSDPNVFQRPSPRIVLAIKEMAELLHPELFKYQPQPLVCSTNTTANATG